MMKGNIPAEFQGIRAEIIDHRVWGTPANALIISLPESRQALSSRDGFRKAGLVCNCYLPKAVWPPLDENPSSWDDYLREVLKEAGRTPEETTALSTGVNMECLAWTKETFDELWVAAFVTAGVKTNAMRVGMDKASTIERLGVFDKVGTINTVLLTGARLDLTALAASFITITEAKNIALQEMDVRSAFNPRWQATGTGTDQIVVVSGTGDECRYVGGHTKIGELMAKAVTAATIKAIRNGLEAKD
ncbi:MAG: adenosylcobinamide amidohydrolase [Dehalococcoidales bacterium]